MAKKYPASSLAMHQDLYGPNSRGNYHPRGISKPGNINDTGATTLSEVATAHREAQNNLAHTGQLNHAPGNATSFEVQVIMPARMMFLSEIYDDIMAKTNGKGPLPYRIQNIINMRGGPEKLKEGNYKVPVVVARHQSLDSMIPRPQRRTPTAQLVDVDDLHTWTQRKFIGLPDSIVKQPPQLPPVGSIIKVTMDTNNYFEPSIADYHGYFEEIMIVNEVVSSGVLGLADLDEGGAEEDKASNKMNGSTPSATLSETERASAEATDEKSKGGWYGHDQPKGKDGQRALNRGGLADFVGSFWDSATRDFGAGARPLGGGAFEDDTVVADELRRQKPSNKD